MDTKDDYRPEVHAARKALREAASRSSSYVAGAVDALCASLQNAWAQLRAQFGK